MPILIEFFIICAILLIIGEGLYGYASIFLKRQTPLFRKLIRYFCMFITAFLLFAHFALPSIADKYLGAKEVIAKLSPKWLLSDQPDIVRLTSNDKLILFASQSDLFTKILYSNIVNFPALAYNYFIADKQIFDVKKEFFGVSIDPSKNDIELILLKLKELGVKSVLIRINYQKELFNAKDYSKIKEAVMSLKKNGYDILLVFAQNRDAFSDGVNLDDYFASLFQDFAPYVSEYQIGETINRPKWGVIRLGEYERFFKAAKSARDKFAPSAKLIAPSVIDFEWLYTVYYANAIKDFDILNALLYVDRVGNPENTQMGSDMLDKIRLMRAVASDKPFYITEFNWPISGTGEYKPTSDKEAVNEYLHACYSVRYALLAIGSNQTSKIYYWQLFAAGYGLIDHTSLIENPTFRVYQTVIKAFSGVKGVKLTKIKEKCYSLKADSGMEALWCTEDLKEKLAVSSGVKYYDMFGAQIQNPSLGVAPIYAKSK